MNDARCRYNVASSYITCSTFFFFSFLVGLVCLLNWLRKLPGQKIYDDRVDVIAEIRQQRTSELSEICSILLWNREWSFKLIQLIVALCPENAACFWLMVQVGQLVFIKTGHMLIR